MPAEGDLDHLLRTPPWFAAMFPGTCAQCREPYPAGFPIRAHTGSKWSDRRWVGGCCAE